LEWRINIKIETAEEPVIVDQPLNAFPLQGFPHSLAVNVGSQDVRQVIKDWHYFEVKVYQRHTEEPQP